MDSGQWPGWEGASGAPRDEGLQGSPGAWASQWTLSSCPSCRTQQRQGLAFLEPQVEGAASKGWSVEFPGETRGQDKGQGPEGHGQERGPEPQSYGPPHPRPLLFGVLGLATLAWALSS